MEIEDSEGNSLYRKELALTVNGTLAGEFTVPEKAPLGYYSVVIRTGRSQVQGGFHVEEYKKPEYEVRVTPETRRVLQGQPIRATVEAKYYFGEPVAGAKVTYVVHRSRYWHYFYGEEPEEESYGEGDEGDGQRDRFAPRQIRFHLGLDLVVDRVLGADQHSRPLGSRQRRAHTVDRRLVGRLVDRP